MFYANSKAETLVKIRKAVNQVAKLSRDDLSACNASDGAPVKRLVWEIENVQTGAPGKMDIALTQACIDQHPSISQLLLLIERASSNPVGKIRQK